MKKILLIFAILAIYSCKNKTEELEGSKTSSVVSAYQFKGLVNMGYDSTGRCHWVTYNVPNDYTWSNDVLCFYNDGTFGGFGGGTYSNSNDITYINEVNWHEATPYGFTRITGYTAMSNNYIFGGYTTSVNNVKILSCDTSLNLTSFSTKEKLFIVYTERMSPDSHDLAPNQLRLFLFE